MSGVCDSTFFGHPLWAAGRVQRSTIIFEKSISKIFIPNFMFVLQGVGPGVAWGSKFLFFSKHGRVTYQIEGNGEQNGIQVKCSPYGQTCDLEV